jgi:cephalosporin-C deacetylase-like acetyl esterase
MAWKPLKPETHNGLLLGYYVMYLKVKDTVASYRKELVTLDTRSYTITGLKPYSSYYTGTIGFTIKGFMITPTMIQKASLIRTMEDGKKSQGPSQMSNFSCTESK